MRRISHMYVCMRRLWLKKCEGGECDKQSVEKKSVTNEVYENVRKKFGWQECDKKVLRGKVWQKSAEVEIVTKKVWGRWVRQISRLMMWLLINNIPATLMITIKGYNYERNLKAIWLGPGTQGPASMKHNYVKKSRATLFN